MNDRLGTLLDELVGCTTFESAAAATLRAVLAEATATLAASDFATRGRMLRGMVHLRPGDGYRRLAIEDAPAPARVATVRPRAPNESALPPSCVPSATAWRWVATHGAPVSIDVNLGLVTLGSDAPSPRDAQADDESPATRFDSQQSRVRLMSRDASHVWVAPLRMPGGGIDGMISLEADCRAAIGKRFVWPDCAAAVLLLAAVAAPYLAALPARPSVRAETDEYLPIIGASMAPVVQMLRVFARQDETVLLSGPTGAGKSRLARWCHEQSPRRAARFETLDLATVPEELQMAELFGWKRGAFTGAVKDTPGCVARAEGGTLFLDEVDKLSLRAQAGLLRVLEERRYRPLGEGAGDRVAEVRFVVGTNADLHQAVRAGTFREDLYYRIHVLPVRVPSLDERRDEIPSWAGFMLDRRHAAATAPGTESGSAQLDPGASALLTAARWPGNLRQLDNIVRRAYALALTELEEPSPRAVEVRARHVERALALEAGVAARPLLDLLHETATAFVLEAERQRAAGGVLDLDHADALRAFVLGAAAQKLGSVEEGFRLLGRESTVQNRNHRKILRAEGRRLESLARALGQPDSAAPALAGLLGGDDNPD